MLQLVPRKATPNTCSPLSRVKVAGLGDLVDVLGNLGTAVQPAFGKDLIVVPQGHRPAAERDEVALAVEHRSTRDTRGPVIGEPVDRVGRQVAVERLQKIRQPRVGVELVDEDDVLGGAGEGPKPLQGFLQLRVGRGAPADLYAVSSLERAEDIGAARCRSDSPHVVLVPLPAHDQQGLVLRHATARRQHGNHCSRACESQRPAQVHRPRPFRYFVHFISSVRRMSPGVAHILRTKFCWCQRFCETFFSAC